MIQKLKRLLNLKVLVILILAGGMIYFDQASGIKLGLDLKGGSQLDYLVDLSKVPAEDQDQVVEGVQEVIRKRVDSLGVSEPNIYLSKVGTETHVVVELAGITDLEEAKATVGKTIQLEFREQNTEVDPNQVAEAQSGATAFYNAVLAGEDFATKGAAEAKTLGDKVSFSQEELNAVDNLSEDLKKAVEGKEVGALIAPTEMSDGYTIGADGQLQVLKGFTVIQITGRDKQTVEEKIEPEVSARHILVSYKGATKSTSERTKAEAKAKAEDLLKQIQGGTPLADLATSNSDDSGSAAKGGDLGSFKKGVMAPEFEEAAFALNKDGISEIVETEFGFHIIQVYDKIEASVQSKDVDRIAYNKISYSTSPIAWKQTPALTGEHFKHADVSFNQAYQPMVDITFTSEGAKLFEEVTGRNVGKPLAIFVGGELISSPNVNEAISGGQAQISGNFSIEEAQQLARDLNTGAIPAPISLVGQYNISATLGAEALQQSAFAGIIGLLVLMVWMLAYYRIPGLIANVALLIYCAILLGLIKIALPTALALLLGLGLFIALTYMILANKDSAGEKLVSFLLACVVLFFMTFVLSSQVTLTLAGIAGVILSIGMAVDANILIFERIKEELNEEKSLMEAINEGFHRAWDSIRDSNFSSLITCAILFYFGSSIIRGFALNLALGILVSMFSAITLTYTFLQFTAQSKTLEKKLWLFGKTKQKGHLNLPFIKLTKVWAGLSGILVLGSFLAVGVFGLNLGLDFTGGTLLEVKMGDETLAPQNVNLGADYGTPHIVKTDQGSFIMRMRTLSEEEHQALLTSLKSSYGEVEEIRFTTVGPSIGTSLKHKAALALAITLIMIVLYIAFAFRRVPKEVSPWRFGVAAIAALVHDIIVLIGSFVVLGHFFNFEIDALFITALLTIMGFSVHDTIVVFDRMRENLRFREANESLAVTADRALNQTLARSVNTSLSALITILALVFFGAETLKPFVIALTIGIIVGTYSSIFIASPLLVWWSEKVQAKR